MLTWPIIAIHAALLADGRVMNFGTDESGAQGAQLVYDIWNPVTGTHTVLPNTTATDIFCAGQTVLAGTGEVLITGGDQTVNGQRNFSNQQTTIFSPTTNSIKSGASTFYPRWYDTTVALGSGSVLVLGGREDKTPTAAITPEVYTPGSGWRTLTGATSDPAFGAGASNWYYPRSWLAPNGQTFVLGNDGLMFYVGPSGSGAITQLTPKTVGGHQALPSLMFSQGKILSLRNLQKDVVIDLNGSTPTVSSTANRDQLRIWSTATVLPDGNVLVTGGSAVNNQLSNVAYAATIWHPSTGQWTAGATAAKPRLYHSTALLLPDASVLVAGGGAPGPVKNLNA